MKALAARKWTWLSALVLLAVGAVVYRFSLDVGFWTDDYSFMENAGRLALPDYLNLYFNPWMQTQWYRPFQGMMWWVLYPFAGREALGYHVAQVGIHLANCLLLFGIIHQMTRRWRLAFLASLIYLTLPAYALAVNWPGVADPLAALFFLLALRFWIGYLQTGSKVRYGLTVVSTISALLVKEIGVAVPFTLFLADLWLVRRQATWSERIKRYAIFFVILPLYGFLEYTAVTQGVFTQRLGYGLGSQILLGLVTHLDHLAFPWLMPSPLNYVWLAGVIVLFGYAAIRGKYDIVFMGAVAVLFVLPVIPFPLNLAQAMRYLYLPLMASATLAAGVIENLVRLPRWRWAQYVGMALLVLLVGTGSRAIGEESVNFAGTTRQVRLQFRPIFQKHPTVGPDTLIYFVQPPFVTPALSGVMFQRYGSNVRVYGTDRDRMPNLRSYQAAYIYYPDDQGNWQEQTVERTLAVQADRALPVQFGPSIALEAYELASANLKRGDAVVLILYWKNTGQIEKDYSLFTHLVNAAGENVAGYDAQPREGFSPTSRWRPGERLADAAVIPIDASVPLGDYKIELGMYDPATMQRLVIPGTGGTPAGDTIAIAPIHVGE